MGYLIRRERLAQNLSQEGLAKGICAVSYLSKIEQGQVEPGQEIIDRLFAALHIDFVRDPQLEKEAERQLEKFFFLREADALCEEQRAFFEKHGQVLSRSEFALSYNVYLMCLEADRNDKDAVKARFEKLKPFFEKALPCALIDLPGWRFVYAAHAGGPVGLWLGMRQVDGRVVRLAYAVRGNQPPGKGPYRPALGLDGMVYQVLWQTV